MRAHTANLSELDHLSQTLYRDLAQPYCDASFKDAEPGKQFYTAWNSMSSLITKQLVVKQGSPAKYYLTCMLAEVAVRMVFVFFMRCKHP